MASRRTPRRTAGPGTEVDLREYEGRTHAWMLLSDAGAAEVVDEIATVLD
ncbi:hypothetical protein Pth03_10880 [Planotetraspora thailandica]|uniref:Uncharacterized protein n=1 Tax=Planotetraspora thailandica TaxID=487172 RepID=A0A8J3XTZ9_9ACTN|nr:hypothetical protein Pth03_10880 [Planotetraspora thailandica]